MDTIFALSSGGLPSGVAVIRLSGPRSGPALEIVSGSIPAPRVATLRSIRNGNDEVLDRGLVLWFPGPASFTGEDVAELHLHGGRASVGAVLERLGRIDGLRPAEQGEFTRRALAAGKFDLTQVEGLADLLAAQTEAQRQQALRQADGALRRLYEDWRRRLIEVRSLLEAHFDFAEEEDVPGDVADLAWAKACELRAEIVEHLADERRGERIRSGFEVVLMGAPNAGKSSLLNALAGREAAIVTAEAGTTRDPIEVHLDLGGVAVTVVDTAGLRVEVVGAIEAEGIRRARRRGEGAELVLWLVAPDVPDVATEAPSGEVPVWRVATKSDMGEPAVGADGDGFAHRVSARTSAGLDRLVAALADVVGRCGSNGGPAPTRARHRIELQAVVAALDEALREGRVATEIGAEALRVGSDRLGRLTGAIGVEDLLDAIFREFCVGK